MIFCTTKPSCNQDGFCFLVRAQGAINTKPSYCITNSAYPLRSIGFSASGYRDGLSAFSDRCGFLHWSQGNSNCIKMSSCGTQLIPNCSMSTDSSNQSEKIKSFPSAQQLQL